MHLDPKTPKKHTSNSKYVKGRKNIGGRGEEGGRVEKHEMRISAERGGIESGGGVSVCRSVDWNLRWREIEARGEESRGLGWAAAKLDLRSPHFRSRRCPFFKQREMGRLSGAAAMKHHVCPNFDAASWRVMNDAKRQKNWDWE